MEVIQSKEFGVPNVWIAPLLCAAFPFDHLPLLKALRHGVGPNICPIP